VVPALLEIDMQQLTYIDVGAPDISPTSYTHLSWSDNQTQIMRTIMGMYNDRRRFYLDPMFNIGAFYKGLPEPFLKYDARPLRPDVQQGDATCLPLAPNLIPSIMLDPPFLVGASKSGVMRDRYTKLKNMQALESLYFGILAEAYRVLMPKGLLVFKCQDVVSSARKHALPMLVYNYAMTVGFNYEDMLTLVRHNPMSQKHRGPQQHPRSADCKFLVFRKGRLSIKEQRRRALEAANGL
jgi:hypothetical protein